jgi:NaMN:DMB phosphoribosyltransferase
VWLAGVQGRCPPASPTRVRVVIFASDHGVAAAGCIGVRLGEGSGALLAVPILTAAADILGGMATFGEANVTNRG